ncbi:hypothetical protein RZS08_50115, partial [Arthrospira platensis SPKY1]|nr:hypothetical protein [Arthrospira platensis SPKY1]
MTFEGGLERTPQCSARVSRARSRGPQPCHRADASCGGWPRNVQHALDDFPPRLFGDGLWQ